MIADAGGHVVISSFGWVDGDALWVLDVDTGRHRTVRLESGARHLSLHDAGGAAFAVAHHGDGARFEVSVHRLSSPAEAVARAWLEERGSGVEGEASAWHDVPRMYVAYLAWSPFRDWALVRVDARAGTVDALPFRWYDERYDKPYQAVLGALALPDGATALVAVQRSSTLVLHDLATGTARGTVALGARGGNPRLALRGQEVWATDYDTLLVLRMDDWRVVRKSRLQPALAGTQEFVGGFSFAPDADACCVARPFRGDVIAVAGSTLRITGTAALGAQPLEVAALPDGEVVARDWKSGALLRGRLRRRRSWLG